MKISETKKLLRDMCRIMGHDYKFGKPPVNEYARTRCSRCKKKYELVAYEEIGMVVYNSKAIARINIS